MSSGSSLAVVLLAHTDPQLVSRTIAKLQPAQIFLHCDVKTPRAVAEAMVPRGAERVELLARISAQRYSWSLVDIELSGISRALQRPEVEHIIVMSGACYPLVSYERLDAELRSTPGITYCDGSPLPGSGWDHRWIRDGGMWRLTTRFLMRGDNLVTVAGLPVPVGRQKIPDKISPHGGSQWKIYARPHAEAVLDVLARDPSLRRYWRRTFTPEEAAIPSILRSKSLIGDLTETVVNDSRWWISWPAEGSTAHPEWLTGDDFDEIKAARDSTALFARKFTSVAPDILDRVDAELH